MDQKSNCQVQNGTSVNNEGNRKSIYVDFPNHAEGLKESRYVLWIDIMGIQNSMQTSLERSANHILRLHIAICDTISRLGIEDISVYPVMDGAYVVLPIWGKMKLFINSLFTALAENFIYSKNNNSDANKQFLVRAAVAFGQVVKGKQIVGHDPSVSHTIDEHREYFEKLLFALPMIQAFKGEKNAPPFGIYVDDTVRTNENVPYLWHKWWGQTDSEWCKEFYNATKEYFDYCIKHANSIQYPTEKSKRHLELFKEYFDYSEQGICANNDCLKGEQNA